MEIRISIIISTFQRHFLLEKCLASIANSLKYCPKRLSLEIILVHNGESQLSPSFYEQFNLDITKIETALTCPAAARNLALKKVKKTNILFLDDDIILPLNYFTKLVEISESSIWNILGGPDQQYPETGFLETALNLSLQSPLATAKTRLRHSLGTNIINGNESNLTLCNLLVKKELLEEVNFDERLFRGEENILIHQLKERHPNIKVIHSPDLYVFHKRRDSLKGICAGIYYSGLYRAKSFRLYPQSFSIPYTAPTAFIVYLLTLITPWSFPFPLYLYIALNLFFALRLTLKKPHFLPMVILLQLLITIVYGLGFIRGLLLSNINKKVSSARVS